MSNLPSWFTDASAAMELGDVAVDRQRLSQLMSVLAQRPEDEMPTESVVEDRHALAGFLAGYAIGRAEGSGQADFDRSQRAALTFLTKFFEER